MHSTANEQRTLSSDAHKEACLISLVEGCAAPFCFKRLSLVRGTLLAFVQK